MRDLLTADVARAFRLELQHARENALNDGEAFDGIIHVVERLGGCLTGSTGDLGKYAPAIIKLVSYSPLADKIPDQWRNLHMPFGQLYSLVRNARNDAVHIGAFARHLTSHSIALALVLEDALRMAEDSHLVCDYMMRDPMCAVLWQPISFIREKMLTNSFSYLPVEDKKGRWRLLADSQIARYLRISAEGERRKRLAKKLEEALDEIALEDVRALCERDKIGAALEGFDGKPILVFRDNVKDPVGIITAFDLL